ncbi:hypothetical protein SNE40_013706 [Patella caerulea]|uniref:Uncharacterized protein n=2 Tax=Patella caerulea TaxID=87958 RepID=A0AAN8JCU8_PATCE
MILFHFLLPLTGVIMLSALSSGCPEDIIKKAQDCFADLSSGVTQPDKVLVSGNLPLDYLKIREYCEKDGHMNRFLVCVDTLLQQCNNKTGSEVLHQLINPDKVRSSVPHLCENMDEIEANADCMNKQMNKPSECKLAAYDLIRRGMAETTGNFSAMFNIQCRFFSVLAECQRTAVADNCGRKLGDLHANFLLSFVPNTCAGEGLADILLPQLKNGQDFNRKPQAGETRPELRNIKLKNVLPTEEQKDEIQTLPPVPLENSGKFNETPGRPSRSKNTGQSSDTTGSSANSVTTKNGLSHVVYAIFILYTLVKVV